MSHRPHAYASYQLPTHPGNPPNTYVPMITAETRVYWTPTSTRREILQALDAAYQEALRQINDQPETYDRPILEVGVDIDSVGIPIRDRLAAEAAAAEAAPSRDEGWVRNGERRCAMCGNPGSNATREGELRHMDAYGHAPFFGGGRG